MLGLKIFKELFKILTISIFFLIFFIIAIPQVHNALVKNIIEHKLNTEFLKVSFNSVKIDYKKLAINFFDLKLINIKNIEIINIESGSIQYKLFDLFKIPKINLRIEAQNIYFKTDFKDLYISQITSDYEYLIRKHIHKGQVLANISGRSFGIISNGSFLIKKNLMDVTYSIKFTEDESIDGQTTLLWRDGKIIDLNVKGQLKNIDKNTNTILYNILPNNSLLSYLNKSVIKGFIENGNFSIHLDRDFWSNDILKKDSIQGNFIIKELDFLYHEKFPLVTEIKTEVLLNNKKLFFKKVNGKFENSLLSGDAFINWENKSTYLTLTLDVVGQIKDLIKFIPEEDIIKTKQQGIDLNKITGKAITNANIFIPLNKEKNTYNVQSHFNNLKMKIFDFILDKANFKAVFNGEFVSLNGIGDINNISSELKYKFLLQNPSRGQQNLDIKFILLPQHLKNIGVELSDNCPVFINWFKRPNSDYSEFKLKTDLENVEFSASFLGINKPLYSSAILNIQGKFTNNIVPVSINLQGDSNLKILGNGFLSKDNIDLYFNTVRFKDIDFVIRFVSKKNITKLNLVGKKFDLSKVNIIDLLNKHKDKKDNSNSIEQLNIDLKNVKLKNDIELFDFKIDSKTISGTTVYCNMNALIGKLNKYITLTIKNNNNQQCINFESDDAGNVFKGLNIYTSISSGKLKFCLQDKKNETVKGNIFIKDFVINDETFLTKIVSTLSFPGLKNIISNRKEVDFKEFYASFSMNNKNIKIENGFAVGPYLDLSIMGNIDTKNKKIILRGVVIPSLFGINTLIKKIPIIGTLLSGGRRRGLLSSPYKIEQKYK